MQKQLLIESFLVNAKYFTEIKTGVTESANLQDKNVQILRTIQGPMGIINEKTANGRIYEEKEILNAIKALESKLKARACLGQLDHPKDEPSLTEVSHLVTELFIKEVNGKKYLYGTWEILNTPAGRILNSLYEAKVAIGTSLRGYGIVDENKKVKDYELVTVDGVYSPSANTYLKLEESKSNDLAKEINDMKEFLLNFKKEMSAMKQEINESTKFIKEVVEEPGKVMKTPTTSEIKKSTTDATATSQPLRVEKSFLVKNIECLNCGYVGSIEEFKTGDKTTSGIILLKCPKCGSTKLKTVYTTVQPKIETPTGMDKSTTATTTNVNTNTKADYIINSLNNSGLKDVLKESVNYAKKLENVIEEFVSEVKKRDFQIKNLKRLIKENINIGSVVVDVRDAKSPKLYRIKNITDTEAILEKIAGEETISKEEFDELVKTGKFIKIPEKPIEYVPSEEVPKKIEKPVQPITPTTTTATQPTVTPEQPSTGTQPSSNATESYANKLEDLVEESVNYSKNLENVVEESVNYSKKLEDIVGETVNYSKKLEDIVVTSVDYILMLENIVEEAVNYAKNLENVIVELVEKYKVDIQDKKVEKLSESKEENVKKYNKVENFEKAKIISDAIRVYPELSAVKEELEMYSDLDKLNEAIRKFAQLLTGKIKDVNPLKEKPITTSSESSVVDWFKSINPNII